MSSLCIIFYHIPLSVRGPTDNSAHVYTGQWSELKEKDLQLYKQMRTPTASLSSVCRCCEGHSFIIWLFGVMDKWWEEICQPRASGVLNPSPPETETLYLPRLAPEEYRTTSHTTETSNFSLHDSISLNVRIVITCIQTRM